jgi:magnesium transporter
MGFFYLSQVLKRPVWTQRGERVASIKDIVARLEALNAKGEIALEVYPPIAGLVVDIDNREVFLPWSHVGVLGPEGGRLKTSSIDLDAFERREGEVLLARDMLDKQLIDIDGRRVVRANDLQLYSVDGSVRVTAVDVSGEALLRRLTFGKLFSGADPLAPPPPEDASPRLKRRRLGPAKLIKWADVEPLRAGVPDVRLRLPHKRLSLLHPVDIAHIADELSYIQGAEIIESLDDERAADTLQEMDEERQADIVESMDAERAADILEEMAPDDAADLLADLGEVQAGDLLRRMDPEDAEDVEELLNYPEGSAGGIMTSDFLTAPPHVPVREALAFIRSLDDAPDVIDYLFVLDQAPGTNWASPDLQGEGRLLGIVSLRDLLLSPDERPLDEIMSTDFLWAEADEPCEKAARRMADYNLIAMPVLDGAERLKGIITIDDAMEVLLPERWLKRVPHVFS